MRHAWRAVLAVGVPSAILYPLLTDLTALDVTYSVFGIICATATIGGALRAGPRSRLPLLLIGGGVAVSVTGDAYWNYVEVVLNRETTFPSIADYLYLGGYCILVVGLFALIRRRTNGGDWAGILDASVIGCGAAVLAWTFVMRKYALDDSLGLLERAFSAASPIIDVLLLAIMSRLLFARGARSASYLLFGGALSVNLVGDIVYGFQVLDGTYAAGGWVDATWLLAYTFWAAGALHPSADRLTEGVDLAVGLGRTRVGFLVGAALLGPACLVLWIDERSAPDLIVVAGISASAFSFVMLRLWSALKALGQLTGLIDQAQADRQQLLKQVVDAAEQHKIRVAGELHDGPIQALSALTFDLQGCILALEDGDTRDVHQTLERVSAALTREVGELRSMMASLRPPVLDEGGLEHAIADHLRIAGERTSVRFQLSCDVRDEMETEIETLLYRTAQECVANVTRHSRAETARVVLTARNGCATLTVSDDGHGFDASIPFGELIRTGHYGIAGMRERVEMLAGSLTIASSREGTTVKIELPLAARPASPRLGSRSHDADEAPGRSPWLGRTGPSAKAGRPSLSPTNPA